MEKRKEPPRGFREVKGEPEEEHEAEGQRRHVSRARVQCSLSMMWIRVPGGYNLRGEIMQERRIVERIGCIRSRAACVASCALSRRASSPASSSAS